MTTNNDSASAIVNTGSGLDSRTEQWLHVNFPLLDENLFFQQALERFKASDPDLKIPEGSRLTYFQNRLGDIEVNQLLQDTRTQLNTLCHLALDSKSEETQTARSAVIYLVSTEASIVPGMIRHEALNTLLDTLFVLAADSASGEEILSSLLWMISCGANLSIDLHHRLLDCLLLFLPHGRFDRCMLAMSITDALKQWFRKRNDTETKKLLLRLIDLSQFGGGGELTVVLDVIADNAEDKEVAAAARNRAMEHRGTLAQMWESVVPDQISSWHFRASELKHALSMNSSEHDLIICMFSQCKSASGDIGAPLKPLLLQALEHPSPNVRLAAAHCLLQHSGDAEVRRLCRAAATSILQHSAAVDTLKQNASFVLANSPE